MKTPPPAQGDWRRVRQSGLARSRRAGDVDAERCGNRLRGGIGGGLAGHRAATARTILECRRDPTARPFLNMAMSPPGHRGSVLAPRRQNRTPAGRAVLGTATANMAAFNPSFATAYEAPACLLAHRSTSRMSARQRTSSRQAAQADATASGSATAPLNAASRSSSRWNRDGTSWPSRTRRSGRFRERRASPSRVTSGAAAIDEKDAWVRVADATAGPHATAPPRGGFGGADIWGHDHSVAPRTGV